jgi:hypothetical protein
MLTPLSTLGSDLGGLIVIAVVAISTSATLMDRYRATAVLGASSIAAAKVLPVVASFASDVQQIPH